MSQLCQNILYVSIKGPRKTKKELPKSKHSLLKVAYILGPQSLMLIELALLCFVVVGF